MNNLLTFQIIFWINLVTRGVYAHELTVRVCAFFNYYFCLSKKTSDFDLKRANPVGPAMWRRLVDRCVEGEERASDAAGGTPDLPEAGDADDPEELGDIAIAWETCMAEAADQQKDPRHHVTHLMVHGILHLLGYDHIDEEDAALMENLETGILAGLGIPDPY